MKENKRIFSRSPRHLSWKENCAEKKWTHKEKEGWNWQITEEFLGLPPLDIRSILAKNRWEPSIYHVFTSVFRSPPSYDVEGFSEQNILREKLWSFESSIFDCHWWIIPDLVDLESFFLELCRLLHVLMSFHSSTFRILCSKPPLLLLRFVLERLVFFLGLEINTGGR